MLRSFSSGGKTSFFPVPAVWSVGKLVRESLLRHSGKKRYEGRRGQMGEEGK
jgi:hypothetical protein